MQPILVFAILGAMIVAVGAWSLRRRPVAVVVVVCSDGRTRELPVDNPRVADYLATRRR